MRDRSHTAVITLILLMLLTSACAGRRAPDPRDLSGFLDDYSLLRPGGSGDLPYVYRNPDARWNAYDKVLLEPVTLWRSGRHALAPIPEEELLRLVSHFEAAVRRRLGDGFELVDQSSEGTLRLRLAITEARASDPVLDVLTATDEGELLRSRGVLGPEMRKFLEDAAIEGELRDAETNALLTQGIDRRRGGYPRPLSNWGDVDRALELWVDRMCSRLEARTGRR
jgi:hypothetical protein